MKISYELAKELKGAGFPQKNRGSYWIQHNGKLTTRNDNGREHYKPRVWTLAPFVKGAIKGLERTYDNAYAPTLSELIEACGEEFEELGYLGKAEAGTFRWYAVERSTDDYDRVYGSTPEEAVARLWLTLNKKAGDTH